MKGPIATLAAGAALGAILLVANTVVTAGADDRDDPAPLAQQRPAATPSTTSPPQEPAGQGETPPVEQRDDPVTYVGTADGSDLTVGLILRGDEATAYLCDGVTEAWLRGTAVDGRLTLSGPDATMTASVDGDRVEGSVTVAGETLTITADRVDAPEGLYQIADTVVGGAKVQGGWIVLPDGSQVGVVTVDGRARRAPLLNPANASVQVDGRTMTADRLG